MKHIFLPILFFGDEYVPPLCTVNKGLMFGIQTRTAIPNVQQYAQY